MFFKPQSDNLKDYLRCTEVIDFEHPEIMALSNELYRHDSEQDFICSAYEYVRDRVHHSADIDGKVVTWKASDVLKNGEGICFAKSHLLAALLRSQKIPAGFCYQLLLLDDDHSPLVLHGLNAVYLENEKKWIRLDARGNKPGVDARFSVEEERLAYSVRTAHGEKDIPLILPDPDADVIHALTCSQTVEALWSNLPRRLSTMII